MSFIKTTWITFLALLLSVSSDAFVSARLTDTAPAELGGNALQADDITDQNCDAFQYFRVRRTTRRVELDQADYRNTWPDAASDVCASAFVLAIAPDFPFHSVARLFAASSFAPLHDVLRALHRCHLF